MNAGFPGDASESPPCLIVNPLSFRASRGLAEQATALAIAHGAEVVTIDSPQALTSAVESILSRRQKRVMVLAGDGTVRAVVDQLAALPGGSWIPDLLVLAGGRTNLTAEDFVPGGAALATLERALKLSAAQRWDSAVVERCVLCIEQAPAPARYGFWVGAALIDGVIRRTHAHRVGGSAMKTGHLSTLISMLRLAFLGLRGRSGLACPLLTVDAGPLGRMQAPVRLLLATTLQHRRGLFDPYATRAAEDMRITAVSRRARRFWPSLPRLLTGRFSGAMTTADGYLSGGCERAEIIGLSGYSLDGEAFDTDPARPVLLRRGSRLRFFAA
ncbi:diacylglycerol kinase family protein [Variovorax sp. RHLX14]|uniref:diacylglycerol kinase family protein n=1 Tax=Variovorax sp. RHLX14 TaxID=1259731 RepID=UPI003F45C9F0